MKKSYEKVLIYFGLTAFSFTFPHFGSQQKLFEIL